MYYELLDGTGTVKNYTNACLRARDGHSPRPDDILHAHAAGYIRLLYILITISGCIDGYQTVSRRIGVCISAALPPGAAGRGVRNGRGRHL